MRLIKSEKDLNITMPILGQEGYLQSKSDIYGWFNQNDLYIAFYIDKKLGFKRMVFSTEVVSSNDKFLNAAKEEIFLNDLIAYVTKYKVCDFIYKAQGNVVFHSCPKNAECVGWGTYEISLDRSEEELFLSFSGKSRNVIRKAIKENVKIEKTNDIQLVYENIKGMFDRQNSFHYPSFSYLKILKNNLSENVAFFIATKDMKIQGSLIMLYDDQKGYAMYAGSIASPQTGSLDLLHFEAMKFLQKKNVKLYDFVGTRINIKSASKQAGIDRFKRKFNPIKREGYAFKVIINPFKHQIFTLLVQLYFYVKGYDYKEAIEQIKMDDKEILEDKDDI